MNLYLTFYYKLVEDEDYSSIPAQIISYSTRLYLFFSTIGTTKPTE